MLYDLVIKELRKKRLHLTPSLQWVNNAANWYIEDKNLRALFADRTVEDIPWVLLRPAEGELAFGPGTWRYLVRPLLVAILNREEA